MICPECGSDDVFWLDDTEFHKCYDCKYTGLEYEFLTDEDDDEY